MSKKINAEPVNLQFNPEHVIWFSDVPRPGFWKLNPNQDRRAIYVDEQGRTLRNPYDKHGKPFTNAEYYEYLWTRGLPIGNGRLGAVVMGAVDKEVIQINESTVWTGAPYVNSANEPTSGTTKDAWKEYRGQLADGSPAPIGTVPESISYKALHIDNAETNEAVQHRYDLKKQVERKFLGTPSRQASYQSFVELYLDFGHEMDGVTNYTRRLDMREAIATVEYDYNGIHYKRESIASYPDQVIATHLSVDGSQQLQFTAELHTFHRHDAQWRRVSSNQIALLSKPQGEGNAIKFEARLWIDAPGAELVISDDNKTIQITSSDQATIYVTGATNYVNYLELDDDKPSNECDRIIARLQDKTFHEIKAEHISDHSPLYRRTSLKLDNASSMSFGHIPTDQRLRPEGFEAGLGELAGSTYSTKGDHELAVLEFNFGKYLLIAGARPGGQPLTLQGLWNATNSPAWSSKYTVNINTEMNYWPAQILDLPESEQTLLDALEDLFQSGKITAKEHYAIDGDDAWVMHHNFDLWRGTQPIDNATAGLWPTSGIWLLFHAWQAYRFSSDKEKLAKYYPYMKGLASFFNQFLVQDPKTGYWITAGSVSPEHGDVQPGPAMDTQLIRFLYRATLQAADILGKTDEDAELLAVIKEKLPRVAPNLIDEDGYIEEWVRGDVTFGLQADPSDQPVFQVIDPYTKKRVHLKPHIASHVTNHKHVSHLWELYPGDALSIYTQNDEEQKLIEAFKKSVAIRGIGIMQGWAITWRMNLRARLADAAGANELLKLMLTYRTSPNMMGQHPPFQIDGNFGATAGIAEMLLQSHDGVITLLPALPTEWSSGQFSGFKARGNVTVDLKWRNGVPVEVRVKSKYGGMVKLRHPHIAIASVRQSNGQSVSTKKEEQETVLVIDAKAGENYTITGFSADLT